MKKKRFLKEKIIYTLIAVIIISVSFISVSYSFSPDTTDDSYYNIPIINYKNTDNFLISNEYEESKKIDLVITTGMYYTSKCSMDFYFVWDEDTSEYIYDSDNIINIVGMLNKKQIFNYNLSSYNGNTEEQLGSYEFRAKKDKTITRNFKFIVSYNNSVNTDDVYKGHIEIRNVVCLSDK